MPNTEAPMTPIRETIARVYVETIIGKPDPDWAAHWQWYLDGAGNPDSCVHYSNHGRGAQHADAVLRALDEAGCVVARKKPDDAMVWAGCTEIVRAHGRECKRCPPLVETPYGAGTQACRLEAEDIYRAMIAAATAAT